MYHRGGDRGWHHRHRRDVFPSRDHQSTPYRGGYHQNREPNNYGQYNHNAGHDRNDSPYMEYKEPTYHNYHEENVPYNEENVPYHEGNRPYHEENRPYNDHREPRDQAYHMRGCHDGGYQKDFHGGYQQNHGESSRYISKAQRKKYPYKSFKPHMKESDVRMKTSTAKPVQSGVYNPVHSVMTPVGGHSQNPSEYRIAPTQDKNLTQETAKSAQQGSKAVPIPEDNSKKTTQVETRPVQNGAKATDDEAKPAQVSAELLKEDAIPLSGNKKPLEDVVKPLDKEANPVKEGLKVECVETNTELRRHSGEQVCDTKPRKIEMTSQLSCKIECLEDTKEGIQTPPVIKKIQDFSITGHEKQEETFLGKGLRSQDEDQFFINKTDIPLLGGWPDAPSDSIEAAGTSTKRHPEPNVDYGLSHTAKELRKAFILAKKEEIELAFSQDCRTFAFVASTLLKKDPSLEVAVSNALRSTLQDIAGRCVQELSKFIDHYDSIPINISERLQNSDI